MIDSTAVPYIVGPLPGNQLHSDINVGVAIYRLLVDCDPANADVMEDGNFHNTSLPQY